MITAIVLAGGRSRRFGGDKLAVDLDGASLLAQTLAAVTQVADGVIVAGDRLPEEFAAVEERAVAVVHDREPFGGPLAALANVLETAADPDPVRHLAIVVGGDMPRLVPAVLRTMLERLETHPELDAVILDAPGAPRRQILPLALRVGPARLAARAVLDAGDRSLTGLVDRLGPFSLPVGDWRAIDPAEATIVDVDTPADLERLRTGDSFREPRP